MNNQSDMPNDDISYEDIISKDIFELMGAKSMPDQEKENLYTKILETVQNRAIARIADGLTEEDMNEWDKVKESKDKTKMNEFLTSKGIDLNKIYLQEALIYKTELVNLSKPIRDEAAKIKE